VCKACPKHAIKCFNVFNNAKYGIMPHAITAFQKKWLCNLVCGIYGVRLKDPSPSMLHLVKAYGEKREIGVRSWWLEPRWNATWALSQLFPSDSTQEDVKNSERLKTKTKASSETDTAICHQSGKRPGKFS
jgi:hypothetical protein